MSSIQLIHRQAVDETTSGFVSELQVRKLRRQSSSFCRVVVTHMIEERSPGNIDEVQVKKKERKKK